jgi:hypothetical protein
MAWAQIARAAERGHDQDAAVGQLAAELGSRLESAHAGHLDVEQRYVGPDRGGGRNHLIAAGSLRDDLEVGLQPEQTGQRAAHQSLVLGDQDADHGGGRGTMTASR